LTWCNVVGETHCLNL